MQASMQASMQAATSAAHAQVPAGPVWNTSRNSYTWTDVDGQVHLWRQVSW